MTHHHSPIGYGDNLRLQPQLSKIVDRAVVKFVNKFNHESDELEGFDDPLYHLPRPAESTLRMCAFRRWHGADWWMVLYEDAREVSGGCTVTRRVTIFPDYREPDTLDLLPDLVVARRGMRFILPEYKLYNPELQQQISLLWTYRFLLLETYDNGHMDEVIIGSLQRAWKYALEFDPSDATVSVSS